MKENEHLRKWVFILHAHSAGPIIAIIMYFIAVFYCLFIISFILVPSGSSTNRLGWYKELHVHCITTRSSVLLCILLLVLPWQLKRTWALSALLSHRSRRECRRCQVSFTVYQSSSHLSMSRYEFEDRFATIGSCLSFRVLWDWIW